jgi:hypothetical protein
MKSKINLSVLSFMVIFLLSFSCEEDDTIEKKDEKNEVKQLSITEKGILGTWYYYSSSYSEYRCITFNSDRTACYYEISKLSSTASKGNQKCYTDWYVDESAQEGSVYSVNIKGDYTGGAFWAGYTINTSDWVLRKDGSTSMTETSKIECDFCY